VNPGNAAVLYEAAEGGGILKSPDGGVTWKQHNGTIDPGGMLLRTVAIDPIHHSTLYVGGLMDHPIAKSSDRGLTWHFQPSANVINPTGIQVAPSDSTVVWACGSGSKVWRTSDGGAHWNQRSSGITDSFVQGIAVNPANKSVAYAGASNGGGVFKTKKGGTSWSPKNNGLTDLHVYELAIDPFDSTHVLAGTPSGVFESIDGGTSWSPKSVGLTAGTFVLSLAFDPENQDVVYVGLLQGGAFRSPNGSDTWSDFNTGLPTDEASRQVNDLAVSSDGAHVFAATSAGLYVRPV
jgi:photosystem II stability/assembly factor-like uncharacterized protein